MIEVLRRIIEVLIRRIEVLRSKKYIYKEIFLNILEYIISIWNFQIK